MPSRRRWPGKRPKSAVSGKRVTTNGKTIATSHALGNKLLERGRRTKKAVEALGRGPASGKAKANGRMQEPVAKSKPEPVAVVEAKPNPPPPER